MSDPVKLIIPSDPQYLCLVRKVLQHLLADREVPQEMAHRLALCVDEACSNIIKYSYEGETHQPIELSFHFDEKDIVIKIRDYGKQCDAEQFKPRPLKKVQPGGLGTYFIYEIMDEVSYCTKREKGTLLTMCKHLENAPQPRTETKEYNGR